MSRPLSRYAMDLLWLVALAPLYLILIGATR
jgi:hypothetical protein